MLQAYIHTYACTKYRVLLIVSDVNKLVKVFNEINSYNFIFFIYNPCILCYAVNVLNIQEWRKCARILIKITSSPLVSLSFPLTLLFLIGDNNIDDGMFVVIFPLYYIDQDNNA